MGGTIFTSWKDAFGVSHIDEPVAVFDNGKIYAAADGFLGTTAKGVLIGEYEDGIVYTVGTGVFNRGKRLYAVALTEYGTIYSISKNIFGGISKSLSVGECSSGKVFSNSHKLIDGRESFGLYNGDAEGAAAAAAIALFKLESKVSANDGNLSGEKTRSSSSSDDEDLWGKYGLLMPIVVTFRFFKYTFVAGKWMVGIIAWIIEAITRLIKNHKEKEVYEAEDIFTETPRTKVSTGTNDADLVSASCEETFVINSDTSENLSDKREGVPDFRGESKSESKGCYTTEKNDSEKCISLKNDEINTYKDGATESRLISTMKTHTPNIVSEKSDKLTPAGDL